MQLELRIDTSVRYEGLFLQDLYCGPDQGPYFVALVISSLQHLRGELHGFWPSFSTMLDNHLIGCSPDIEFIHFQL
jgi:hypothetical protein